jgi:hypothetical protein
MVVPPIVAEIEIVYGTLKKIKERCPEPFGLRTVK